MNTTMMTPLALAGQIATTLDNKKASDIRVLKTEPITVLADYFVICTGTSNTHLKTLVEEVDKVLSEQGQPPLRREGYRGGSWVLLDFGCVIVHLFSEQARSFYNLEHLWADAADVTADVLQSV